MKSEPDLKRDRIPLHHVAELRQNFRQVATKTAHTSNNNDSRREELHLSQRDLIDINMLKSRLRPPDLSCCLSHEVQTGRTRLRQDRQC